METIQKPAPPERMWRWCLAGNIVEEHPYGEARELRRVANEYCEDALKRTEETLGRTLDGVRKARVQFKSLAKN